MSNYILLAQAQKQLEGIRQYTVELWGKEQAKIYLETMTLTFVLLSDNPQIGIDRSHDIKAGVMSFRYKRHIIYYRHAKGRLVIIAVLHHGQLPQNYLYKAKNGNIPKDQ